MGIIDCVVKASRLFAFEGLAHHKICYVDDVAKFAELACWLGATEEVFGLFVEDVETIPGTLEAKVASYDANIITHDEVDFSLALCDEHHLVGMLSAFVVPVGHIVAEVVAIDQRFGMSLGSVGIDHSLDQRVGGESVAAMQAGTTALTQGIESADRTLAIQIDLDAAAEVVGCRSNRDHVARDVDADAEAFLVDVGEVMSGLFGVFMGHVEVDMV